MTEQDLLAVLHSRRATYNFQGMIAWASSDTDPRLPQT